METRGVGIEDLLDAVVAWRFYDEAGVGVFADAVHDLGVGVGACVGVFLASETEDDTGVVVAGGWRRGSSDSHPTHG